MNEDDPNIKYIVIPVEVDKLLSIGKPFIKLKVMMVKEELKRLLIKLRNEK